MKKTEQILPRQVLNKGILSGSEMGWKQEDIPEVIAAAEKAGLAIIGGQVQFIPPGATCELYWLNYDSEERTPHEDWEHYSRRSAEEVLEKFNKLCSTVDILQEGVKSFDFLAQKKKEGVDLNKHLIFMLYFKAKD